METAAEVSRCENLWWPRRSQQIGRGHIIMEGDSPGVEGRQDVEQ